MHTWKPKPKAKPSKLRGNTINAPTALLYTIVFINYDLQVKSHTQSQNKLQCDSALAKTTVFLLWPHYALACATTVVFIAGSVISAGTLTVEFISA